MVTISLYLYSTELYRLYARSCTLHGACNNPLLYDSHTRCSHATGLGSCSFPSEPQLQETTAVVQIWTLGLKPKCKLHTLNVFHLTKEPSLDPLNIIMPIAFHFAFNVPCLAINSLLQKTICIARLSYNHDQ